MEAEQLTIRSFLCSRYIGAHSEWRCATKLAEYGWRLFISPGSRGPADFLAIKENKILAVQCKTGTQTIGELEGENLIALCRPIGAIPIFTYRADNKTVYNTWDGKAWVRAIVRREVSIVRK